MSSAEVLNGLATPAFAPEPARRRLLGAAQGFWRKVGERSAYALADQVVYSFGNMVVAAIVSRQCGMVAFGVYILTQRAVDLLCQLSNAFLWTPYTFYLPGLSGLRRSRYEGSTLVFQLLLCLCFSLGLASLMRISAVSRSPVYSDTFAPLVLTGGALLFREFTRRMYFAHLRLKEAFWTDMATVLLQILGVGWFSWAEELTVPHALQALAFGAATVSLWWLVREWTSWRMSAHDAFSDVRLNFQMGRWFLGSNLLYAASSQCNPWFLGTFAGAGWVGMYAICESVVNIPRVAINSLQNVMSPVLARAHNDAGSQGVQRAVRRLDRTLIAGSLTMALLVVLFGPRTAQLIFKSVPANARLLLVILSLNLVAYAGALAPSFALAAFGRANRTFYSSVVGFLVQVTLCTVAVHRFQVAGAAGSLLLGNLIVYSTRIAFYRAAIRKNLEVEAATVAAV